jgi:hypothetical protein
MKSGQIFLSDEIKARGFHPRDLKTRFKSKPESLLVNLYLGTVTPDSLPHFSADGALLALGYGPSAVTRVQYGLVKALESVKYYLSTLPELGNPEHNLATEVQAALTYAENFTKSAGPLIDPIMEDAARFRFAMACALEPQGPAAQLADQIGAEMEEAAAAGRAERGETGEPPDTTPEQEQERFLHIIDEARKRWGAHHG